MPPSSGIKLSEQMKHVKLNPDEVTVCQIIGRMRSLIARSAKVDDKKMGTQDGCEADVLGLMAEYGFSKLFNTFPDLGLSPRSGSADGIIKEKGYDVKSTTHKNGRLLSTKKVNPDVDVYVLAIVDGASITFPGWAYKADLIKNENLINLGFGEGYGLTQDKLRRFQQ
jgi:hypothetical protein|tara:strand:+ start:424 stop:927 length:504 start_codon:yes stop_codon:yes gene_type:complete